MLDISEIRGHHAEKVGFLFPPFPIQGFRFFLFSQSLAQFQRKSKGKIKWLRSPQGDGVEAEKKNEHSVISGQGDGNFAYAVRGHGRHANCIVAAK